MMTTERLNEIKRLAQERFNVCGEVQDERILELVAEIERLKGLEENRKAVQQAAEQGAKGLKEPDGVKCTGG